MKLMTLYKLAPDVLWVTCLDHVVCLTASGLQATVRPEVANYFLTIAKSTNWVSENELLEGVPERARKNQLRDFLQDLASAELFEVKLE
jgi:hypothetical protein